MYFVERLTLRNWFFSVLPRLLYSRAKRGQNSNHCYFFDASGIAVLGARAAAWISGVRIEKLSFRLVDVRDEEGLLLRLRIAYRDLAEVLADTIKDPTFCDAIRKEVSRSRIPTYLAKGIAKTSLTDSRTIWRALLLIQISAWKVRCEGIKDDRAVLFLELRPWAGAIERYAHSHGVSIIEVSPTLQFNLRALAHWLLSPRGIETLRILRGGFSCWRRFLFSKRQAVSESRHLSPDRSSSAIKRSSNGRPPSTPRVGVEYYGHLNLNQPELHSDLFFCQQSSIAGSDVVVTFALPRDPLDEAKWRELAGRGIGAVALEPQATTVPAVPLFTHRSSLRRTWEEKPGLLPVRKDLEEAWLKEQLFNYRAEHEYWTDLFRTENIKVYVSWFKHDSMHCAIADAIRSLGGVAAIYERSCEMDPCVAIAADTDIMFGFSSAHADIGRQSGSIIRYHVTAGYLGDHRFPLLRDQARGVRDSLRKHGAERILAFFDENSGDDSRWHTGHEFMRDNYAFILEKVLNEPRLGLVIKPKVPSTLRRRLGPVSALLERAVSTGRCHLYEGGALHGSYPPAVAALASDITIHGHLCAVTAGLEAALAGVPTLLLDREGWSVSSFYRLGVGRVVFRGWNHLWEALTENWAKPGGIPGFGDWSSLLDELDPFRDGRAAERMGTYIKWLIDGFKAGLDRETVMADAAERYCKQWGQDKVTEVNGRYLPASERRHYLPGGLEASAS